jgi:transposase
VSQEQGAVYLEQLTQSDPHATHIVLQDQAGFHLREGDERLPANVRLLPLPPYSPELNPVEHVGDLLKDATANRVFATLAAQEAAIEKELRPLWEDPARVRAMVGHGWLRTHVNVISPSNRLVFN